MVPERFSSSHNKCGNYGRYAIWETILLFEQRLAASAFAQIQHILARLYPLLVCWSLCQKYGPHLGTAQDVVLDCFPRPGQPALPVTAWGPLQKCQLAIKVLQTGIMPSPYTSPAAAHSRVVMSRAKKGLSWASAAPALL